MIQQKNGGKYLTGKDLEEKVVGRDDIVAQLAGAVLQGRHHDNLSVMHIQTHWPFCSKNHEKLVNIDSEK